MLLPPETFASMAHFGSISVTLLSVQYIYVRRAVWPLHPRAASTYLVDWSQDLKASSSSWRSSTLHRWWPHRRILRRSSIGALHLRRGSLPEGKSWWISTGSYMLHTFRWLLFWWIAVVFLISSHFYSQPHRLSIVYSHISMCMTRSMCYFTLVQLYSWLARISVLNRIDYL
jgi:hypothetical protein